MIIDHYVPKLIGMRPLKKGRLALSYWNEEMKKEEVRVYDVWKAYPKKTAPFPGWYDRKVFKSCYLFGGGIFWDEYNELWGDHIYSYSVLVKEDFHCVK